MFESTVMMLRRLASLKLTLVGMVALAVGVLASYKLTDAPVGYVMVPLVVLCLNLVSALITNPRFRRQAGLLVFHYCLVAVIVVAAVGQMTRFKGRVEITQGQMFTSDMVQAVREGPWHPRQRLNAVSFRQGPLSVEYAPRLQRGRTRSHVATREDRGLVSFGDNVPFEAAGYRFYTTSNKGYAVLFNWFGDLGDASTAAIHLSSYPLRDWKQIRRWTSPGGSEIKVELQLAQKVPMDRSWILDSRDAAGAVKVTLQSGRVQVLTAGDEIRVPGGRLRYQGLRMWMGYEVVYDPTLPWLFAAAFIAVLGLVWHFWTKIWSRPLPGVAAERGKQRVTDGSTVGV
jgi:cytochrome c biogenesis protein